MTSKKSIVGAMSGTALAAALLVAPSAGAVGAPQMAGKSCGYQTAKAVTADVSAAKPFMRQRERNTVVVHVTSAAGAPRGTVTVKVGAKAPTSKRLSTEGYARFPVPTSLVPNRTYTIRGTFAGQCPFANAEGTARLTVYKK